MKFALTFLAATTEAEAWAEENSGDATTLGPIIHPLLTEEKGKEEGEEEEGFEAEQVKFPFDCD